MELWKASQNLREALSSRAGEEGNSGYCMSK